MLNKKRQSKHEVFGSKREHHKHRPTDRSLMRPSPRPCDNLFESFTPLNIKCVDILMEMYHLKLILEPPLPKRVSTVLGNDSGAWCAYHHVKDHHTKYSHHLKREIENLIQRGRLLSYVKEEEGEMGKRSSSKREPDSKNTYTKKGKNTEEIHETQMAQHTLNNILGGFICGGENISARKRYAQSVMHGSQNSSSKR